MSDPDAIIARLDDAIDRRGQMIRLIRWSTGPEGLRVPFEVRFKANVRATGPTDVVQGGGQTIVTISPTDLQRTRFPGLPRKDDHLIVSGDDPADIQRITPTKVDDVLVRVRVECQG